MSQEGMKQDPKWTKCTVTFIFDDNVKWQRQYPRYVEDWLRGEKVKELEVELEEVKE